MCGDYLMMLEPWVSHTGNQTSASLPQWVVIVGRVGGGGISSSQEIRGFTDLPASRSGGRGSSHLGCRSAGGVINPEPNRGVIGVLTSARTNVVSVSSCSV